MLNSSKKIKIDFGNYILYIRRLFSLKTRGKYDFIYNL